ncbi:MAG: hypothetical protein MJZ45_00525 [Bacteroidales bacterium]|nr:hypothetical protein [Bacteroidales bacterium]
MLRFCKIKESAANTAQEREEMVLLAFFSRSCAVLMFVTKRPRILFMSPERKTSAKVAAQP